MRKEILALACLFGLLHLSPVQAISLKISADIQGVYDEDFNPLPVQRYYGFPVIYQFDISFAVKSLAPGEDSFGGLAFNVDLYNFEDAYDVGWTRDNPVVDYNGFPPGGLRYLFSTNADVGASDSDEQGILIQMEAGAFTSAFDPRRNVGEPGGLPGYVGSLFLRHKGYPGAVMTISGIQYFAKTTTGQFTPPTMGFPVSKVVGWRGPEPSSLVLAGLGMMASICRRHQR